MGIFIPIDYYAQILNEVGRFKIITMRNLYQTLNVELSYSLFCRKVKKLEYEGLIRSIIGMRKSKILTLTNKGSQYSKFGAQYSDSDKELNHDLIASNVILELDKLPTFKAGSVIHSTDQNGIESDGLIYFNKGDKNATLGIEVELTQKSKDRIAKKFCEYTNSKEISYSLFIFNKESVFRAYKNQIDSMINEVTDSNLLLLDESLSSNSFSFFDKEVYFSRKFTSFKELFGIEDFKSSHT